jgi:hypothetical protein
LAKNDSILVDGIIAQRVTHGIPSGDKGEVFEFFSFEQILKNYDLSEEEIETGWVDGRHDGGIDGFFIFVNGHLVSDVTTFPWPRSHAKVDIFIISCKHHDTFKESTLNSVLATVYEIFDLSRDDTELKGAYSKDVLNATKKLSGSIQKACDHESGDAPKICIFLARRHGGYWRNCSRPIRANNKCSYFLF